jgi:hypothetical protein
MSTPCSTSRHTTQTAQRRATRTNVDGTRNVVEAAQPAVPALRADLDGVGVRSADRRDLGIDVEHSGHVEQLNAASGSLSRKCGGRAGRVVCGDHPAVCCLWPVRHERVGRSVKSSVTARWQRSRRAADQYIARVTRARRGHGSRQDRRALHPEWRSRTARALSFARWRGCSGRSQAKVWSPTAFRAMGHVAGWVAGLTGKEPE